MNEIDLTRMLNLDNTQIARGEKLAVELRKADSVQSVVIRSNLSKFAPLRSNYVDAFDSCDEPKMRAVIREQIRRLDTLTDARLCSLFGRGDLDEGREYLDKLLKNGTHNAQHAGTEHEQDFMPVVKLFHPAVHSYWLLSEISPFDHDRAFGLADIGQGCAELGDVYLCEIQQIVVSHLGIESSYFTPTMTLSEYARQAHEAGMILDKW